MGAVGILGPVESFPIFLICSYEANLFKRHVSVDKHACADLSLIFPILAALVFYEECAERRMRHMLAAP